MTRGSDAQSSGSLPARAAAGGASVRVAVTADVDAVLRLAEAAGAGLTSLPNDRDAIMQRLGASVAAVGSAEARESGAAIMLVAELDGALVATGMIFARVGAEWPFYSYRLTRQAALSRTLGRSKAQWLLNLANDFDGETEVGGLFVDPSCRGLAIGRLMAQARYLFIGRHRSWFGKRVIAELRGYQDEVGQSPVWEAIGRHFYDMEFHDADRTGALHGNQFIADFGPRYPLYVSLLSAEARAALGQPHRDGRPARDMLLAEGFRDEGYVDIFDGGPTLVADIDALNSLRLSKRLPVATIGDATGTPMLAACGEAAAFRAAVGALAETPEGWQVDRELADRLGLALGANLVAVPL